MDVLVIATTSYRFKTDLDLYQYFVTGLLLTTSTC